MFEFTFQRLMATLPSNLEITYVHLVASTSTLAKRIQGRGRPAEFRVSAPYLERLRQLHFKWLRREARVYELDANDGASAVCERASQIDILRVRGRPPLAVPGRGGGCIPRPMIEPVPPPSVAAHEMGPKAACGPAGVPGDGSARRCRAKTWYYAVRCRDGRSAIFLHWNEARPFVEGHNVIHGKFDSEHQATVLALHGIDLRRQPDARYPACRPTIVVSAEPTNYRPVAKAATTASIARATPPVNFNFGLSPTDVRELLVDLRGLLTAKVHAGVLESPDKPDLFSNLFFPPNLCFPLSLIYNVQKLANTAALRHDAIRLRRALITARSPRQPPLLALRESHRQSTLTSG
jgi:hypothetical protein